MNIISSSQNSVYRANRVPKGPIRKATEAVAGALGGVAGSALYAVPSAIAGAEYSYDRRHMRSYAGSEAVANILPYGMLVGAVAGTAIGASSHGLVGAGVGLALGFTAGGVAGFGAFLTQHAIAGRDDLGHRLGGKIEAAVDANRGPASEDSYWPDTKTKTTNIVKGFRAGTLPGVKVGYEIGKAEGSGAVSGLLDGVAGFGKTLTFDASGPDQRGIVKRALNIPLGLVAGAVGAAVTVPGAAASVGDYGDKGSTLKVAWGVAATVAGAAVGGLLTSSATGAFNGAVLAGVGSIILGMGEDSPIAEGANTAVRHAVREGRQSRQADSNDQIHHNFHNFVQDRVLGTAAGLNVGFSLGYRGAGQITDKLVDLTVDGAKALLNMGPKVVDVASGIKEGLS
jgi:hypothetical protein